MDAMDVHNTLHLKQEELLERSVNILFYRLAKVIIVRKRPKNLQLKIKFMSIVIQKVWNSIQQKIFFRRTQEQLQRLCHEARHDTYWK